MDIQFCDELESVFVPWWHKVGPTTKKGYFVTCRHQAGVMQVKGIRFWSKANGTMVWEVFGVIDSDTEMLHSELSAGLRNEEWDGDWLLHTPILYMSMPGLRDGAIIS
jgi:hypothetical protein